MKPLFHYKSYFNCNAIGKVTFYANFSTTLLWCVMLMALHPEVQVKCQKEIDEGLGQKPPTIEDMNRLTYVTATLMEIQRFAMVAPGSLAHYLLQDTQVGPYMFKKGTLFTANLQKFLDDPREFPQPRKFIPERQSDQMWRFFAKFWPFFGENREGYF